MSLSGFDLTYRHRIVSTTAGHEPELPMTTDSTSYVSTDGRDEGLPVSSDLGECAYQALRKQAGF